MLVIDYFNSVMSSRMVRPSTARSYLDTIRHLHLSDVDMEDLNAMVLHESLMSITNTNTRRKHIVALRSIFRDFEWVKQFRIPKSIARVYDFPSEETIRFSLMLSPYELQGLLMMYGGLRVGESCAVSSKDIRGNLPSVNKQRDINGRLIMAKTTGQVVLPHWLAQRVSSAPDDIVSPGAVRESLRRNGLKSNVLLTPHLLRHWYATRLVMNKVNPEIARQQMRHSDIKTTLTYYVQFDHTDVTNIIEGLFNGEGQS